MKPGYDEGSEDTLLAAFVELHRKQRRGAEDDSAYGRVLRHFERRGNRLRGERLITAELIEKAFRNVAALPACIQQELEITGPLGASASGRFRIENRTLEALTVEWVYGAAQEPAVPVVSLRFEPPRPCLAPGEACTVRVIADLSRWKVPARATIPVEYRADGRRDRLWLIIDGFAPLESHESG